MELESTFGGGDEVQLEESKQLLKSDSRWRRIQSRVWIHLEYPSETVLAKVPPYYIKYVACKYRGISYISIYIIFEIPLPVHRAL